MKEVTNDAGPDDASSADVIRRALAKAGVAVLVYMVGGLCGQDDVEAALAGCDCAAAVAPDGDDVHMDLAVLVVDLLEVTVAGVGVPLVAEGDVSDHSRRLRWPSREFLVECHCSLAAALVGHTQ